MSIPRIYLRNVDPARDRLVLDRAHRKKLIRVLRLGPGDIVHILSPGRRAEYRIVSSQPENVELEFASELPAPPEPRCRLILAQAIPKSDRFDWLIQKATELGVAEIYPLITERTVVRPDDPEGRMERWNEIADSAAAQCEGAVPAWVHAPVPLDEFARIPQPGVRILLHEREGYFSLRNLLDNVRDSRITFVVGPEGGWTADETTLLTRAGYARVQLGSRVLRSDTAGLALAAILQYCCGDFSD